MKISNQPSWDHQKEKVLEHLLRDFSGLMRAYILKHRFNNLGVDIEDILQEIRIKLWKIVQNEKFVSNYPSYIKKIVDTSIIDFFRKFKREEGIYLHEKQKNISDQRPRYDTDYVYEEMDIKDLVGKAVEGLIESRRRVVRLYLLNMSIDEIALYFNWTSHKTRNLLYRGLKDLKRILKEKDINYEHQP